MKITSQQYNDVAVVEMHGEFTEECLKIFEDNISSVTASGCRGIVLDMTNIGFVDSRGLEKLLWLRDYCHDCHCHLKLAGVDENCGKILEITRLGREFDSYDELAEAVKSFA